MTQLLENGLTRSERDAQKQYWQQHSSQPTVEAMMLDSKASEIDVLERPEVLGQLGDVKGKRVVELGAGIGRFTGELAAAAQHVLAMDFMDTSISENERINGHRGNCSFQVGDVTELELPTASCDVVFSNWLLMYLSDAEVTRLACNALRWLTDGGVLFFRESCFRQSGDRARKENPTHYRNPREYFRIVDSAEHEEPDGGLAHFELVNCKCIDTYVRVKRNQNQICWKWRKVVVRSPRGPQFRHFLDGEQYTMRGIAIYERIFGMGFVSSGGHAFMEHLADILQLQPGQRVLDVGCGTGGQDFYMSEHFGVHVHGIDLSVNMVLTALERAVDRRGDVTFEVADCTSRQFPDDSFDCVYSRDTILHIRDKPALFRRLFKAVKPGGQLLFTDYCRSDAEPSAGFASYIAQRGYTLHTVQQCGEMLQEAGFTSVRAADRSRQFESDLKLQLAALEASRADFVAAFSEDDYSRTVENWRSKVQRVQAGEQRWGLFLATKPGGSAQVAGPAGLEELNSFGCGSKSDGVGAGQA